MQIKFHEKFKSSLKKEDVKWITNTINDTSRIVSYQSFQVTQTTTCWRLRSIGSCSTEIHAQIKELISHIKGSDLKNENETRLIKDPVVQNPDSCLDY